MSLRSSAIIVASPRPRVGKTLLARLLIDYQLHNERQVAGFDLNGINTSLAQFLPDYVTVADIGSITGQMALFDRLVADDGIAKVVDVGHETLEAFVTVAGEIGFAEEARRHGVAPAVLYMMTPDMTSVEAYKAMRKRLPQAMLVPVQNMMLGATQYHDKYPVPVASAVPVRLPVLSPALRKFADRPPFSFAASPSEVPLDRHLELSHWVRRIFVEFREMELQLLLADLQSSIQLQS